jgi:hypothetical protein
LYKKPCNVKDGDNSADERCWYKSSGGVNFYFFNPIQRLVYYA